jgi:hypothetical protein
MLISEEHGYAVISDVLPRDKVDLLREEFARLAPPSRTGGVRSLGQKSEIIQEFAVAGVPGILAKEVLGSVARPVKITGFDKNPRSNWKVPWHQDLTIAVREKRRAEGFGPWSIKDGTPHVQPPADILSRMLTVRVHLDDTPADNGALRVIPGSHRLGRIAPSDISGLKARLGEVVCPVGEGGVMLMKPLLLHASSVAHKSLSRRVVHIEYAGFDLPFGLQWL